VTQDVTGRYFFLKKPGNKGFLNHPDRYGALPGAVPFHGEKAGLW